MESDCHMTNPENNFFRTFEIEFSSKNRNFLFAMNFESPIKKSKNIAFFIVNNITFFFVKWPFCEKFTFLTEIRYCFWFSVTFKSQLPCIYFNVLTWIFSPKPNRIFFQFEVFTFLITKKCLF